MRILILDTYYPDFLDQCYMRNPELAELPYEQQLRWLLDQRFGTSDFYSTNLIKLGHEAAELIINCEPLQRQWAIEHGLNIGNAPTFGLTRRKRFPWLRRSSPMDWLHKVLAAQITEHRPDVLYVQDMNWLSDRFLREIKSVAGLIVGQIACPVTPGVNFRTFDLILSSFPHFVDRFRREGLDSQYLPLGFEPRVLSHLSDGPRHSVVFVGNLSSSHQRRIDFLERLASAVQLDVWGPGAETLHADSPLRIRHHGEAWALEMYQVFYRADIVINHHIDLAESFANNMRLYEATGVGSLLLTDWKQNLDELFVPDREVVAYQSVDDAIERIRYYLEHDQQRKEIAAAGQQRTLREHSYSQRMQELTEILQPRLSATKEV